ncbi:acyl-CoA dehydrogenase family protein [Calderihabitans maritimus]|uniref:Butyryl-CoA dehydrogenase n=1 Tax=Calderihabitans maritimus TaxID=1246530 RepID=A0A1Z5HUZ3_9FIRM|nr:acyl-CoA dehydrogenase family protein [Calderihabitans maritimus]GAW93346.1 butyryl-CoA dehydrogenase [Calderihabitans maritimus]
MVKGGEFLIKPVNPSEIFTPEDLSEEHRLVAQTVADFTENTVVPHMEELEEQKEGLMRQLLEQAGELGLLGTDVPEEYGGEGMDKICSILIAENIAAGGSFAVAHGAHTGIGTLPIVFFGNEEQKKRYLPDLASGRKIAAYALTEPGAGSDALSAKTKAVLSEDGRYYILNGTKQFITNAGLADVFVTYAKIDGDKFTAFIVDRDTEGLSLGAEEKKMGIKGSSTRSLIFEDAKVPVENVLGQIGRGHVVAFNILNLGRFKLAAGCVGSAKLAFSHAVKYALERQQFGRPIAHFGLIQEKIGRMAAKIYAAESMVYRTAGLVEKMLAETQDGNVAQALQEYAVECSINKVHASEALDYVADEAVQIFGGYGYTKEYPVEQIYRDSRINRIFEGTNEINRLLIPGTLLRRAQKGELALLAAAQQLAKEIMQPKLSMSNDSDPMKTVQDLVDRSKKIFLQVGGLAVQKYMDKIQEQQEILGMLSDICIETYAMESAVGRAFKAMAEQKAEGIKSLLAQVYVYETFPRVELRAREALSAMLAGDELQTQLSVLKRFARYRPVNLVGIRRQIAQRLLEAGKYTV